MKVIDLLNKIANGEEVPKKINYDGLIYIYDIAENNYISEKADYYDGDYITHKYLTESFEFDILNDEVEIISDEEEFEDIKPLEQIVMKKVFYKDADDLAKDVSISFEKIDDIVISINYLIKNQKKIIEKLNKNSNTQ